jgi:hypothetical protein
VTRCLGCGRGGRRGAGADSLWWLSDGEQGGAGPVKVAEEETVAPQGGATFIAARGDGRGGGNSGRKGGGRRGGGRYLRAVSAVQTRSARGSYRAADGGPHAVLIFFFNLTKTGSNLKFEKEPY